ncbi:dienelactone hydrolase family protein [Agrococcus versicolor]|uniref:Dienelactone hydrolase family protein n=1 Tax=Agrococcus versicolor TaxID=501482 RepID=A0ABP5MBT1_9MICO
MPAADHPPERGVLADVRAAHSFEGAQRVTLLLHGFGSHEHDLVALGPAVGGAAPWASLRAPLRAGAGAAWFPIATPGNPAREPVESATAAIWAWVDEHVDQATDIVAVGFSQGGLMATQLLRSRPERVVATVALGGFVLDAPQSGDEALAAARPPVFWGRGADDLVIAGPAVARTASWLPPRSTLDERVYPGLAHGIHAAEIADARAFVDAVAPTS